jgi:Phage portal protein/Phage Mu protein F like protein
MADGGIKTTFDQGIVARVASGLRTLGEKVGFFSPTKPMPPVAQEQAHGRQYDYGMGVNLVTTPRREEPGNISFQQLRAFADSYDLLRLVIETRKDQLAALQWNIVGRESDDKVKNDDPRVLEIEKFLRRPNGVDNWHDWLRIVVEDMLVIDAATIYPRKKNNGGLFALENMDGATIKLLVDDTGRTPLPPDPAYAQILKGMPAVHYTRDELIYKPRNKRSWKLYGMSPVEQIVMTVNIALRRQVTQLAYYTEGNIPEAFATTPVEWTPQQVGEMQDIWDSLMQGQAEKKRHLKFIPGGTDIKFNRDPQLKDLFDEWLARIVCYAFSVSPQALVQLMNRATAETAAETAQLEGLAPLQVWVKGLIDDIIEYHFGYDDLVFEWDSGEELDPKTQAEIHRTYIECNVLDVDEVRKDIGRDPRATAQQGQPGQNAGAPPVSPSATPSVGGDQSAGSMGVPATVAAAGDAPAPQLGPDGQPVETPEPVLAGDGVTPLPTTVSGDADVQGTAMNGTQISSLLEIINQCAAKDLPEDTVRAILVAAYPAVKQETIDAMLTPLRNFEQPKPKPIAGPDGKPIAPGADATQTDEADEGDGKQSAPSNAAPPPSDSKKKDKAVEKLAKAHRHYNAKAKLIKERRKKLAGILAEHMAQLSDNVAEQIVTGRKETVQKQFAKSKNDTMFNVKRLLAKLDISFDEIEEALWEGIADVAKAAAEGALKMIRQKDADVFSLANTRAEKWADGHSAELVKEITDTTRDLLRATIVEAEQEGWSNETLAKELRDNYAFSKQRADTIARTELKSADSEGAIAGWRASGLKMKKEWVRSANDADCDICEANEAQGPIDLDEEFDSGDDTAPAHPNCECAVLPVLDEDQEL